MRVGLPDESGLAGGDGACQMRTGLPDGNEIGADSRDQRGLMRSERTCKIRADLRDQSGLVISERACEIRAGLRDQSGLVRSSGLKRLRRTWRSERTCEISAESQGQRGLAGSERIREAKVEFSCEFVDLRGQSCFAKFKHIGCKYLARTDAKSTNSVDEAV